MPAKTATKTSRQLAAENEELRARLEEAEETLRAIRSGEVDALVVSDSVGERVFTLTGADSTYRALIERMNEGALSLTTDGMILYANQRFASMLKTPLEEVIGSTMQSWVVRENQGTLKMLLELAASGTCRAELGLKTGDDTTVPVYLSANALSAEGTTSTLGVIAADLTDRYRTEEALRQSEQKFQAMFDESPLPAMMATYPGGLVVSTNRAFEKVLGFTDQQVFGKTSLEIGIKVDAATRAQIISELKEHGSAHDIEARTATRSGEARVLILNLDVVKIGNEQYVLQVAQDITGRKQAEQELSHSEQRFSVMFDRAPIPIALSRLPDAQFVKVNHAFAETFGLSTQEAAGKTSVELGINSDLEVRARVLSELLEKGSVHNAEALSPTRSGEQRLFLTNLDIVTIGDERYILHMLEDITERRKAEEQIAEMNRDLERRVRERTVQLEAVNKELEAFSYSVSHDLRAPLRAIDGLSRIVLDKYAAQLPQEGQHYLDLVRESTHQMGELLEDLLVLSRLGRHEITIQPVEPTAIVHQVIDELGSEREGRQVEFVIGNGTLPPCRADAGLLHQVYTNLLSNAIKFTRQCPVAHIEVGAIARDGVCAYYVKDDGIGFDMQYADKLFGVFQRLHSDDGYEGTGVGLAICQRIIERHGGRIWAEAEVDKGATFYFTLQGDESHDPGS